MLATTTDTHYIMTRDLKAGDIICDAYGRYYLVLKDMTRSYLNSKLWANWGVDNLSKQDIIDYYDIYDYYNSIDNRYITELKSSTIKSTYIVDEYDGEFPAGTLIQYNGEYYYSTSKAGPEDVPGTSSKWFVIQ